MEKLYLYKVSQFSEDLLQLASQRPTASPAVAGLQNLKIIDAKTNPLGKAISSGQVPPPAGEEMGRFGRKPDHCMYSNEKYR